MTRAVLMSLAAGIVVAGCQTTPEAREPDPEIAAEIAARQGDDVSRICFAGNINNWKPLGRESVLLERGVNNWYRVQLSGTCDPRWAFDRIAIRTRGGNCLSRGDRINTDDRFNRGFCLVDRIYEWDETAEVSQAALEE